jgi:SOS response regulatory protein OraA/RecX
VSDDVVVRAGLSAGLELDRPALRRLRAELRRSEAFNAAGRALVRRPLSRARLATRLERAGVAPAIEQGVLGVLEDAGVIDDERLAHSRARALAERGWGDAAIEARLEEEALGAHARAAIVALPPERERAAALVSRGPAGRRAMLLLARRGFCEDSIESAVGLLDAEA